MLRLRVIKKYYDQTTGLLAGYRVRNIDTGEEIDAAKDPVKNLVVSGQAVVENMTLTSDGRLIGRAGEERKHRNTKSGIILHTVFTNGRRTACALVDETQYRQLNGLAINRYACIEPGFNFHTGLEATERIRTAQYDNVKIEGGKPVPDGVKRMSFSKIVDKLHQTLVNNNIHGTTSVEKGTEKYQYIVSIDNYSEIVQLEQMVNIIYVLIENSAYSAGMKVDKVGDGKVSVICMTGINDVRKAVKSIGVHKF